VTEDSERQGPGGKDGTTNELPLRPKRRCSARSARRGALLSASACGRWRTPEWNSVPTRAALDRAPELLDAIQQALGRTRAIASGRRSACHTDPHSLLPRSSATVTLTAWPHAILDLQMSANRDVGYREDTADLWRRRPRTATNLLAFGYNCQLIMRCPVRGVTRVCQ
jgi:hypothetical protein